MPPNARSKLLHVFGRVADHIHNAVEAGQFGHLRLERGMVVAVARHRRHSPRELLRALPAIIVRHPVAAFQQQAGNPRANQSRSPDNQNVHDNSFQDNPLANSAYI